MQENSLLIVCYNVIKGGGIPIVDQFLGYCIRNKFKVTLLCPNLPTYHAMVAKFKQDKDLLNVSYFNLRFNHILLKPIINYVYLPIIVARLNVTKIYNLGNVAFPTSKPQFLLMHNAFAVYKGQEVYNAFTWKDKLRQQLMNFFIRVNFRFATVIGVQTETIRETLKKTFNRDAILIPNFSSDFLLNESCFRLKSHTNEIKLLFLSKYYAHKNFNVLIPLVRIIKDNKRPYKITLTIDNDEPGALGFIEKIKKENLLEYFNIIGNVATTDIETIYQEHDGLFLPTLIESFSGTYVEAMRFAKPIFTSDRLFAKEVCRDAAFYFDPIDASSIFSVIDRAYSDISEINKVVKKGQDIVKDMSMLELDVNERILKAI